VAYHTPKNRPPGVRTPNSKSLTEALILPLNLLTNYIAKTKFTFILARIIYFILGPNLGGIRQALCLQMKILPLKDRAFGHVIRFGISGSLYIVALAEVRILFGIN